MMSDETRGELTLGQQRTEAGTDIIPMKRKPPMRIHPCPSLMSIGSCSASVPRRRSANQMRKPQVMTVAAQKACGACPTRRLV